MLEEIDTVLDELVRKAGIIASAFMEHRTGSKHDPDRWSDLVLKARVWKGSLSVEWYQRVWNHGAPGGRRYKSHYLRDGVLLRYAKHWERAEVESARDRLRVIKAAYQDLKRLKKSLAIHGLFACDLDIAADFIPHDSLQWAMETKDRRDGGEGQDSE